MVMDIYYLLVQRSLWTVQLLIAFFISSEGRHFRRNHGRHPPEILPGKQNVSVHSNERVVLKCTVRNRETKDVQWRLVNTTWPLTIGMETWTKDEDISVVYSRINETDENWDLVIKNAKLRHTNTYECQIATQGSHKRYVFLKVKPKRDRKPTIALTGTAYIDIYQRINLTCNASGAVRAPGDVDWFHNGNIIDEKDPRWGGRLRIYKKVPPGRWLISELIIDRSNLNDQGKYVCRSSEDRATSFPVSVLDTREIAQSRNRDGVPNKTKRTDRLSEQMYNDVSSKGDNKAQNQRSNIILLLLMLVFTFS